MAKKKKEPLLLILSLIAIILIAVLFALLNSKYLQVEQGPEEDSGTVTTFTRNQPYFTLKTKDQTTTGKKEDTVTVLVLADSKGERITGYDVVLRYDQKILDFVEARSRLSDFQAISTTKDGTVTITGVKKLTTDKPSVFDQTVLLETDFIAKELGSTMISFDFSPGQTNESNLINEQSEDVLADNQGMVIKIGQALSLVKDMTVKVSDEGLSLTLTDVEIPDKNCRDCFTSAVVRVEKDGLLKMLEFKQGGFAGLMENEKTAFEYTFKLETLTKKEAMIVYVKI